MCRTGAKLDRALLIAIAERSDLYGTALDDVKHEAVMPFADQQLSALLAQTLISGALGENVSSMAQAALEALGPEGQDEGSLLDYLSVERLRGRLQALAQGKQI